ncbi:hypothetical protein QTP86_034772, partial [Hemibagrus guttatus]
TIAIGIRFKTTTKASGVRVKTKTKASGVRVKTKASGVRVKTKTKVSCVKVKTKASGVRVKTKVSCVKVKTKDSGVRVKTKTKASGVRVKTKASGVRVNRGPQPPGLISNNNETAYLEEIKNLETWCQDNNLLLNVSKTKELIVDFSTKQERNYQPLINGTPVERVDRFQYLGVHITRDLSWSCHVNTLVKKARQRLYHLRLLKDLKLPSKVLKTFYTCTIESILMGSITAWFGNSTKQDRQALCDQLSIKSTPSSLTWRLYTASGAGPKPGR